MDKRTLIKLATIRRAISHELRQRMIKRAQGPSSRDIAKGGLLGAGPKWLYDLFSGKKPTMPGLYGPVTAQQAPSQRGTVTLGQQQQTPSVSYQPPLPRDAWNAGGIGMFL